MPCFHPLKALKNESGVQVLRSDAVFFNLMLPCGRCHGCRLERSRQWAMRCMHEASLHSRNCFITLTYSPEHLPSDNSLHHEHFQKFIKRFRKRFGEIRYYMCGEYGDLNQRPHYHALIFGFDFNDRVVFKRTNSGSLVYRSKSLESLWPFGYSSVGDVSFESAAYVARYVMKKRTGDSAFAHYANVDMETGEILNHRRPDYNKMSLKPGIGADWFEKYASDVYPHDYVVINGKTCKPPRYYDKLIKRVDSDIYDSIKNARQIRAYSNVHDNSPSRLEAKEKFSLSRTRNLKRNLE